MYNAWSETWICALISILPAYIFSEITCYIIYAQNGVSFSITIFGVGKWLLVLLFVLLITLIAVSVPIVRLSFNEPMHMINAQNNVNLIVSPKSSFNLLRAKFPFGYEMISAIRFRKHYIGLALSSAALCACFVVGCFTSALYTSNRIAQNSTHDISVQFLNADVLPDSYPSYFSSIGGVASSHTAYATYDAGLAAHLLHVNGNNVSNGGGLPFDSALSTYFTGDIRYLAASGLDTVEYLSEKYTISGNPLELFDAPNNILIGSSFKNQDAFSYAYGDTVTIAVPSYDEDGNPVLKEEDGPFVENASDKELWIQQNERLSYTKKTFRIVGVIEGYPSATEGIPVVFQHSVYEEITGSDVKLDTIYIKGDEKLSLEDFIKLEASINQKAASLNPGNYLLLTSDTFFEGKMQQLFSYNGLILFISYAFLIFIPLNWLYSQWFFFKRRGDEFYALHSVSASLSRIRSIFLTDALFMLPIGLISGALALGLSKLFEWLFSYLLPNLFGLGKTSVIHPTLPIYVYGICIGLSFISCILSALLPYASYRRMHIKAYLAEKLEEDSAHP